MFVSSLQQHIIQRAGAVGEFFSGHAEGVEHCHIQIIERYFAVVEHVELTVFEAEVFAAAQEERVVTVVVSVAVAAAVIDEGIVEQGAVGLGCGGEFWMNSASNSP